MGETTISWTARPGTVARTWNPTQGCALKSEGCRNCYAMRQARRFAGHGKPFDGLINLKTGKWTGEARLAAHKLDEPLSWRAPSTVFVDSMSDLFYEGFTNEQIAAVFGVMAAAPQHTFQVLTKRAKRMREWFAWASDRSDYHAIRRCGDAAERAGAPVYVTRKKDGRSPWNDSRGIWPLPNVWLGVSVENQAAADERIPDLLATPAAVRFLSCEPLLGELDLSRWLGGVDVVEDQEGGRVRVRGGDSGRDRDRSEWRDLAGSEADRRRTGRGALGAVQAGASGSLGDDGLPEHPSDDRREAHDGALASPDLVALQRSNSRWPDGEPQERDQARQPAGESRARNRLGAADPRNSRVAQGAGSEPGRHDESRCEADDGAGRGDSSRAVPRGAAEQAGSGVRDHIPARLGDRAGQDSIGWIIAGAESGPRARACDVQWLRSLRDQCAAASVPFFLKQAVAVDGAYTIHEHRPLPSVAGRIGELVPIIGVGQGSREKGRGFGGPVIELPYLDGKQHAEFPR